MHDLADIEARGVPSVFVASSEFVDAASAQERALGCESLGVFVAHPIQDRTDDELRELADRAVHSIVDALIAEDAATAND